MAKKKHGPSASPGEREQSKPAPAGQAAASGEAPEDAPDPRPAWKEGMDFVVMLGGAVLIALLIKAYIFDVYLIPSGSMETTLHGRPDGGDRIFCSKLNYRFRDLRRWEIAVFEFPYESARRADPYSINEQYKGQNFVKRVVGLPGESLIIARGDIWVKPDDAIGEHKRVVKPDSVQRGMWQRVYGEDFSDLRPDELGLFWKTAGAFDLPKGGPLRLKADGGLSRLDYRPLVPAGQDRGVMAEMPGIPDRYVLEQPVQFACRALRPDGTPCGHLFVKMVDAQNIQGRCPACGSLQDETSVVFYHRRSGLPEIGRYAVSPAAAPQGEKVSPRQSDYHIVPDLRVVADLALKTEQATFSIILREDNRQAEALFAGDGRVEIRLNGAPSAPQARALADLRPGGRHRAEFYLVDGTARIYLDGAKTPVLDLPVWDDKRPTPRNVPRSSGVALLARGGDVELSRIGIDRDIFYYSGRELDSGEKFPQMSSQGEVYIAPDSFFPMGDHCPSSYDARSWGPVPLSLLRGPALFIWWPPERVRMIASP